MSDSSSDDEDVPDLVPLLTPATFSPLEKAAANVEDLEAKVVPVTIISGFLGAGM